MSERTQERYTSRLRRWRDHYGISASEMSRLLGETPEAYIACEEGANAGPVLQECLSIMFGDKIPVRALLGRVPADNEDILLDAMTEAFSETLAAFERRVL